ncbi:MAG: ATP-grasp fold amidoligase family protein [Clostridia bacterium]
MVEQFIGDDAPAQDYKLMCFGGLPRIIQVHTKRDGRATIDFFNLVGQKLEMRKKGYPTSGMERLDPSVIGKLFPIAKKLAAGFPYVRVDLYMHDGHVYFGEMTFFDSAAFREFEPEPVNVLLGDMIALPGQRTRNETNIGLRGTWQNPRPITHFIEVGHEI